MRYAFQKVLGENMLIWIHGEVPVSQGYKTGNREVISNTNLGYKPMNFRFKFFIFLIHQIVTILDFRPEIKQ